MCTMHVLMIVDELSSARIWQHKLCDIVRKHKNKLPSSYQSILPYLYFRHIRIEINQYFYEGKVSHIYFYDGQVSRIDGASVTIILCLHVLIASRI
jgi:hypothetical protein